MSEVGLLSDPTTLARLTRFLAGAAAATSVAIIKAKPLRGGAIQENWAVDINVTGGPHHGRQALVLRTDARSRVAVSHARAQEFALLKAAHTAGVTVPEALWLCTDPTVLGRNF
jgi:aminoglycoside phosphotransferase (APT) family kinase protein